MSRYDRNDAVCDAQGKFLEQLLGDRIHLLTGKVQK
jgi:hypothetical protein